MKSAHCGRFIPHSIAMLTFQMPCKDFRKMKYVTIADQRIYTGQYVLAKPVFNPGSRLPESSMISHIRNVHICSTRFFFEYSFHSCEVSTITTNPFACVEWLACHPQQHVICKPFEVWYSSLFELLEDNSFVPLENIQCLLLSSRC